MKHTKKEKGVWGVDLILVLYKKRFVRNFEASGYKRRVNVIVSAMAKLTIFLVTTFFSILATGTIQDKDIDELSKIIQKEIELKRKAVELLQNNERRKDSTKINTEKDDIPLSLNHWVKRDDAKEKEETKDEISIKSDLKNVLLKKEVSDGIVADLYKRLKSETNIPFVHYSRKKESDESEEETQPGEENEAAIPLFKYLNKRLSSEEKEEEQMPFDYYSNKKKDGVWSERPRRGPPGLWGKKDGGERKEEKPAPPGIWGDESEVERLPLKWGYIGKRDENDEGPQSLWARTWGKKDEEVPKHFGGRWGKKDGESQKLFNGRWGKKDEELPKHFGGRWGRKDEEEGKAEEEKRYLHEKSKPSPRWGGRYGDQPTKEEFEAGRWARWGGGKKDVKTSSYGRRGKDEQRLKLSNMRKLLEEYERDTLTKRRNMKQDIETSI